MDITFHYPPELFELLVDTISILSRSKIGVLQFFQGAGVNFQIFEDLWQQVDRNKAEIRKVEIVRTILTRLNTKGEATLRERREILKRVVEFEDFSSCWPEDQLKAQGLVSQIRRVQNVKDSFTRMKQEVEKESQKHQAEQQTRLQEIQKKQEELQDIKEDLFSLFAIPNDQSQKRGKLLESVLNRLFKANDILVREAFELVGVEGEGIIEQVDGVVELDGYLYLVEMKWWGQPLGTQEISPHLVKVFNRGHTGGIFISNSKFTQPAITICKEALAKKIFILCELEEIVTLLELKSGLKEFLRSKIQAAAIDKNPLTKPLSQNRSV